MIVVLPPKDPSSCPSINIAHFILKIWVSFPFHPHQGDSLLLSLSARISDELSWRSEVSIYFLDEFWSWTIPVVDQAIFVGCSGAQTHRICTLKIYKIVEILFNVWNEIISALNLLLFFLRSEPSLVGIVWSSVLWRDLMLFAWFFEWKIACGPVLLRFRCFLGELRCDTVGFYHLDKKNKRTSCLIKITFPCLDDVLNAMGYMKKICNCSIFFLWIGLDSIGSLLDVLGALDMQMNFDVSGVIHALNLTMVFLSYIGWERRSQFKFFQLFFSQDTKIWAIWIPTLWNLS